ncbi:hypothetical protein MLD38_017354 [Melastoma candidum]|uniref:Uncharacterized protein n=1 Tax=Melastoma candidum TaxID=119954 RepID=A0ACB9QYK7_9MYRT|nr:hypothetical protein MLD38_017354 [Melastoma candidum]
MVLSRRLEYGFNGYQVPTMPRAARSARRRSSVQKNLEDGKFCAFDLLATLAGNLLVGKSSSSSTSNSSTQKDDRDITNLNGKEGSPDNFDQPSPQQCEWSICDKEVVDSQFMPSKHDEVKFNPSEVELPVSAGDEPVELTEAADTKDRSERSGVDMFSCELENAESARASDVVGDSPSAFPKLDDEIREPVNVELCSSDRVIYSGGADVYSLKDHVGCDKRPLAQSISNNNSQVLPCDKDKFSHTFPVGNGLVVVSRDDDENSSGWTHPSSYKKPFRTVPYIGDRRIRKVLASQSCRAIPRCKDKLKRTGVSCQTSCQEDGGWYNQQKCLSERNFPFKKRKFYNVDCQSFSDKEANGNGKDSICSGQESFTSTAVPRSSLQDVNSHVKLRIESFKVPELFIEMPETATIGSLKRAVMEAVTTILGGGLHVSVLLHGKKVGDDSKTLQQTGISHDRALDALGFMLEPGPTLYTPPIGPGSSQFLLHCESLQPLMRYADDTAKVHPVGHDKLLEPRGAHSRKLAESDRGSSTSPMNILTKGRTESKAIVPISSTNAGALSAIPLNRKPKQSEIAQRRIRRPFSVAEVEALVQAVEKLGTGRWRDVKLRAFESAKHRTYVDLKDKWKTLVHTAKISPQQRRGEPVPQELLDRVLTAHAYWSQHQARQHLKQLL